MLRLRTLGIAGAGIILLGIILAAGSLAAIIDLLGGGLETSAAPSTEALSEIPASYLQIYLAAAATCPGLPWTVLAGIGQAETDQGRDDHTSSAGAVGPMQFELATFAQYERPVPPGGVNPATPYDPTDAIYAAARDLCANGARNGTNIAAAIYAYNHSENYVTDVLADAAAYSAPAATTGPAGPAAAQAVSYALAQIGTPYRWGGETPGLGFDCSGLTQAAYAAADVTIPRTSEDQWLDLPHVPLDQIEPGDLLFFNPGELIPGLPGHVGIYIGNNQMIDAPHAGADVQIDNLADWPTPLGAARPTPSAQP